MWNYNTYLFISHNNILDLWCYKNWIILFSYFNLQNHLIHSHNFFYSYKSPAIFSLLINFNCNIVPVFLIIHFYTNTISLVLFSITTPLYAQNEVCAHHIVTTLYCPTYWLEHWSTTDRPQSRSGPQKVKNWIAKNFLKVCNWFLNTIMPIYCISYYIVSENWKKRLVRNMSFILDLVKHFQKYPDPTDLGYKRYSTYVTCIPHAERQ